MTERVCCINYKWTKTDIIHKAVDKTMEKDQSYKKYLSRQINSFFHPEVSDECARNIKCSTNYAYKLFQQRGNFSAWTCGRAYGY